MIPALLAAAAALAQATQLVTPWAYRDVFKKVALARGGDENLLHAIAWHESLLDPQAVGPVNANGTRDYGLMQINENNFADLGLSMSTVFDPETNVTAAQALISRIRARAALSASDVISIYNEGAAPGGLPRKLASGAYVNQAYVDDVISKYRQVRLAAFAPLGA